MDGTEPFSRLSAIAIAAHSGVRPMRVFQGIASGLVSRALPFKAVLARRCLAYCSISSSPPVLRALRKGKAVSLDSGDEHGG
jgi:hypothetical protein